jgi:hypothetical protein
MNIAPKLSFDPAISYRFRTLEELNKIADALNYSKDRLGSSLLYYLQKYGMYLDIPRFCRALAVPGEIAEDFIRVNNIAVRLEPVRELLANIRNMLQDMPPIDLSYVQREAVATDINELGVYAKMYYDIEIVKANPLISAEYPNANPFDHVVDIMRNGGIIVRFKYVSRNGSRPEEKVVSYHPMKHSAENVLGVHIQGDEKFSMRKQWGEGDEKLLPLYDEYETTIVRWGRDDVEGVLEGRSEEREFLY